MAEPIFVPLATYREYPVEEMKDRASEFEAEIRRRRTVREFSERPVPREIIENCLRSAGTAPNGQPAVEVRPLRRGHGHGGFVAPAQDLV